MAADPFTGLGNDAWAQLFGNTPTINQLLAADTSSGTDTTNTTAIAKAQGSISQSLKQIPVWVWVVLGGSLLIVLTASKR